MNDCFTDHGVNYTSCDLSAPPRCEGKVAMQIRNCGLSSLWIWAMPAGYPRGAQGLYQGQSIAEPPHTHRPLWMLPLSRSVRLHKRRLLQGAHPCCTLCRVS